MSHVWLRSGKRQANGGEEFLIIKRFGEESSGAFRQRGGAQQWILFGGKHDDASRGRERPQLRLDFQATHERHPDINHRHWNPVGLRETKKRFRIVERFYVPAGRLQQATDAT